MGSFYKRENYSHSEFRVTFVSQIILMSILSSSIISIRCPLSDIESQQQKLRDEDKMCHHHLATDRLIELLTENGAKHKMAQHYWGARGLRFGWVKVQYTHIYICMSRLSTKNYKPRATGSLRHLMLKVLARHTITAPYRLNYSTSLLSISFSISFRLGVNRVKPCL